MIYLNKITFKDSELIIAPLWHNSLISTENLFFPHWYKAGISIPLDVVKPDGQIMNIAELRHIFQLKTNFLEYYRVEKILKNLIEYNTTRLDTYPRPIIPPHLRILTSRKKASKHSYETLNCQFINQELRNKWNNILKQTINDDEWNKIYKICFKTTGRNDLIWLQFRIIHRILGTRSLLYKMKIADSDLCRLCKSSVETIHHLFVVCPKVSDFWKTLQSRLQSSGLYLKIDPKTILFGSLESEFDSFSKNLILLVAKKFVWTHVRTSEPMNMLNFQHWLQNLYEEQEYIAKIENKLEKFYVLWSLINDLKISITLQD